MGPLRPNMRVYIALPEDALYKKNSVPSSGRRTAQALEEAFRHHTKWIFMGRFPEALPESVEHARENSCDYAVYPTILKWEDHPTEWNAVRDRLEVRIDVVSVETSAVVRTTTIQARSKFMTDGEDAPQDLLPEPVDKFVRSLFRRTYTPSALPK